MKINRTRFAPSPTGYMHIGNLRTALYAYLVAKKTKEGVFILRIEDTDQKRKVDGAVDVIYDTLKHCGLHHDEGPDIGGQYGPYIQSERMETGIYKEYAFKMVENKKAHICFCKEEDIAQAREVFEAKGQSFIYNDPCKLLSDEVIETRIKNESYVIRQNINPIGSTSFIDEVYGTITVDNATLDEMVLLKSDGYPTYNFANVVDDHLMGITHVVRGNEYLSSTPKYNLIYNALNWEIPKYIHCPPVMKDEQNKLSKRNGDASYQDLIEKGYLPEAILNYIALLGWSPVGEKEIFSLNELIEEFDVSRIGTSGSIFDINKLNWMNGIYIRNLDNDKYYELVFPIIQKNISKKYDIKLIADILKERINVLNDIPIMIDFFEELPEYEIDLFVNKKMKTDLYVSKNSLEQIIIMLKDLSIYNHETIHNILIEYAKEHNLKNGQILYPLRVALSGKAFTPGGGVDIANILGKEETIRRIQIGLEKLNKEI